MLHQETASHHAGQCLLDNVRQTVYLDKYFRNSLIEVVDLDHMSL